MNAPHKPDPNARPLSFTGEASLARTVRSLGPYIWPKNRLDLKLRVLGAMMLLLVAKLVTIAISDVPGDNPSAQRRTTGFPRGWPAPSC